MRTLARILSLGMCLMGAFALCLASFGQGVGGYSISIENGAQMTWEYTGVNKTAIQLLESNGSLYYDSHFLKLENGYKISLSIIAIREYNTSWHVDVGVMGGLNLDEDLNTWDFISLEKSPGDVTIETPNSFYNDDWRASGNFVFPVDVEDYLKELQVQHPMGGRLQVSGRSLTINGTVAGAPDAIVLNYNGQGVLENGTLFYKGEIAAQVRLTSFVNGLPTYLIFTIIVIASFVVVGFFCVRQVVEHRESKLARQELLGLNGGPVNTQHVEKEIIYSDANHGTVAIILALGGLSVMLFFFYFFEYSLVTRMSLFELIGFYFLLYVPLLYAFRTPWFYERSFTITDDYIQFILSGLPVIRIKWEDIEHIEVTRVGTKQMQSINSPRLLIKVTGPKTEQLITLGRLQGFPKHLCERIIQDLAESAKKTGKSYMEKILNPCKKKLPSRKKRDW
jgi:hypothetical protein